METETFWPSPVASRWMIAVNSPIIRCIPLLLSPSAEPLMVGGPSQNPVVDAAPPAAWATFSYTLRSFHGESSLKPLTEPKIRRGFSAWMWSQPRPIRSMAPGAKFSTRRSASRISLSITSLPSGDLVSMARERLLLFSMVK